MSRCTVCNSTNCIRRTVNQSSNCGFTQKQISIIQHTHTPNAYVYLKSTEQMLRLVYICHRNELQYVSLVPHVSPNGVSHFSRTCTCTEIDTVKQALMNNAQACSETKVSNYPKSPTSSPPSPRYTICGNCRNSFGRSYKCILVHQLHYVQRERRRRRMRRWQRNGETKRE